MKIKLTCIFNHNNLKKTGGKRRITTWMYLSFLLLKVELKMWNTDGFFTDQFYSSLSSGVAVITQQKRPLDCMVIAVVSGEAKID